MKIKKLTLVNKIKKWQTIKFVLKNTFGPGQIYFMTNTYFFIKRIFILYRYVILGKFFILYTIFIKKNIFPLFFNLMNYLLDGTYFSYFHHKNCDCIPIKICSIQKMSILFNEKNLVRPKRCHQSIFKKRKIIMKFNYFFHSN